MGYWQLPANSKGLWDVGSCQSAVKGYGILAVASRQKRVMGYWQLVANILGQLAGKALQRLYRKYYAH